MRVVTAMRFGALAGALALAACGGSGNSEFAAKIKDTCEKSPQGATLDCACVAATIDKELDEKTKSIMLTIEKATAEGKNPIEALQEAGVSQEEAPALMSKLTPAMTKAQTECAKK